jgi:hypothetical protein
MAVSEVARPQGKWPAAVFYPFGHPTPYADALHHSFTFPRELDARLNVFVGSYPAAQKNSRVDCRPKSAFFGGQASIFLIWTNATVRQTISKNDIIN